MLVGALIAAGMRHFYALISFGFCLFVALTILIEFYKGGEVHRRQERHEPAARHGRADASQHAPLRRLPGPHGHRADVHRLHRPRLQLRRGQGTQHRRRPCRSARTTCKMVDLQQGENDELPVAPRHHAGLARTARCSARSSPRSASTQPAGRAPREVGIRAAAQRRSLPEFRRHVGRQPARRDSGVRLPAGLVDLDRRRWC